MFPNSYGNYTNGNGYVPSGNPSPATSAAIQALVRSTSSAADMAAVSPSGQFLSGVQRSALEARVAMAQQVGMGDLPPGWQDMPLDQFLQAAARARRNLPGRPSQGGAGQTANGGQPAPLGVHAHAHRDSDNNPIPVTSVTVNETGNWNSQERSYNQGQYLEFDTTYQRAKLGKYYTVTTTWQDGQSQTTQVRDQGYTVDVY